MSLEPCAMDIAGLVLIMNLQLRGEVVRPSKPCVMDVAGFGVRFEPSVEPTGDFRDGLRVVHCATQCLPIQVNEHHL